MTSRKKVIVLGLGIEGLSLVKYFSKNYEVSVFDEKVESDIEKQATEAVKGYGAKLYLGNIKKLPKFDIIARSPAVRPDYPLISKLTKKGSLLTSATKIFFNICKGEIIGVTGTKGKGTTCTLIYKLLKTQYNNVHLAGNIGIPMLDILPKIKKSSKVVLELSSFQLMDLGKSPHIAVALMATSEHLNWHKDQNEYLKAKSNISKYQNTTDYAVINADFPKSIKLTKETKAKKYFFSTTKETNGVYVKSNNIISAIGEQERVCTATEVLLPGRHNLQNVLASCTVAKIYGITSSNIRKVLKNFKGLEHRLQLVATKEGVKYYNDSFSTIPETTIAAMEAFNGPKILVLGGSSKNSDFRKLINKIETTSTVKNIVLIGKESIRIKGLIKDDRTRKKIITGLNSMAEVVTKCKNLSKSGDIVLLSPACASFDMFKNYKDRGNQFIKAVNLL